MTFGLLWTDQAQIWHKNKFFGKIGNPFLCSKLANG